MKICEIEQGKAGRMVIHLEEGLSFPIGNKECCKLELKEGKELSSEQLEWIFQELVFPRGRNYLIYLLASRDYTTKEIEQKLRKTAYPENIIEQIIAYGTEKHYLDDYRYAEDYIRCRKGSKSVRQLLYQLKQKGIASSILNELIVEDDKEELLPKVQAYWKKKKGTPYEKKAKTCQYFIRKGYDSGLIRELVGECERE